MSSAMSADQLNSFLEKLDILCAKLKEEDCPICDLRLTEDKTSCVNGHGICGSCKLVVTICPECSANYPGDVSAAIPACANGILQTSISRESDSSGRRKCINSVRGCQTSLSESEICDHELSCTFRSYICKICSVDMCLRKLKGHCERSHKQDLLLNSAFHEVKDGETQNGSKYFFLEAHNEIFWFWRNNTDRLVFSGVQFCGNVGRSSEFKYSLEVVSKDQKSIMKFGGPVLFDTPEIPKYSPIEDYIMIAKNLLSTGSKFKVTVTAV